MPRFAAMAEVVVWHAQKGNKAKFRAVSLESPQVQAALQAAKARSWPFVVHIEFAAAAAAGAGGWGVYRVAGRGSVVVGERAAGVQVDENGLAKEYLEQAIGNTPVASPAAWRHAGVAPLAAGSWEAEATRIDGAIGGNRPGIGWP